MSTDTDPTIRPATADDRPALAVLLEDTGLFGADELSAVLALLDEALAGRRSDGHRWRVALRDGEVAAAALVAPEPFGNRVANLFFLGTLQRWRRRGLSAALVGSVAADERALGTRLLVVDTGSSEAFAPARALYAGAGFIREATIRGFYGDGEDKVTFVLPLAPSVAGLAQA